MSLTKVSTFLRGFESLQAMCIGGLFMSKVPYMMKVWPEDSRGQRKNAGREKTEETTNEKNRRNRENAEIAVGKNAEREGERDWKEE